MSERSCAREQWLGQAKTIIIKVGSAVLTNPAGLDYEALNSLASQITRIYEALPGRKLVLVSSGAVAAGRAILKGHNRIPGQGQTVKQALAAIGQGRLMQAWTEAFAPSDIVVAQALLTREDFHSRERFQNAANAFGEMLDWGCVPIVNENDTVAVHELKFGDNDTLASLLVNLVEADLFVNLTSAPGVLGENPEKTANPEVLSYIQEIADLDIEQLCGKPTAVGSGGMYSKLLAARRVAQLGVPTLILPGRKQDVLLEAFNLAGKSCENPGTWICPAKQSIPRRKFWLAYQSEPEGTIKIDSGAAEALQRRGKSLLPGGIIEVLGDFEKGALTQVEYEGAILGVGFCNYNSHELRKISGLKRHEIAAILGDANYPDAIHRDNLLLDAAV